MSESASVRPIHADGTDEAADAARQTRIRVRSEQLLGAAARLMAREGANAVSMQALAGEARVSVGLIYRYFGGKDELLLAVICNVLDAFAETVPAAISAAGPDPVRQLAAAFRAYCEVIDAHRHAAVLTYREGKHLSEAGLEKIKRLEVETSEPLRSVLRDGIAAGVFVPVDIELVTHNLLLLAHGWALKHWYLERTLTFGDYVAKQTALTLGSLIEPRRKRSYRDLLAPAAG
jgi:AcrR family transcriptional regulator